MWLCAVPPSSLRGNSSPLRTDRQARRNGERDKTDYAASVYDSRAKNLAQAGKARQVALLWTCRHSVTLSSSKHTQVSSLCCTQAT
jgi:hypothetical protein